jgi:predicted NAD/FAD-binding protein
MAAADIAQARALLGRAERASDPAMASRHTDEALTLLEEAGADATPDETRLIANLRVSYARRLLARMARLQAASFETWSFYYTVLVRLNDEVEALTAAEPGLAANREQFVAMWGPDVRAAIEKSLRSRPRRGAAR